MKICFLLPFTPDPRIKKRIKVVKKDYTVAAIYWRRSETNVYGDFNEDIECEEIKIQTNFGRPMARIHHTFLFAWKAFLSLKKVLPDAIYIQGLDMLFIAFLYSKVKKNKPKLIYEVADIHSLLIDPQTTCLKKLIQKGLTSLEKWLCQHIDLLVNTSEKFFEVYYSNFVSRDKLLVMPNVPEPLVFQAYKRKTEGPFTVGFIGAIRYKDQLKMLIKATGETDTKTFIAGASFDDEIKLLSQDKHWVTYYGRYDHATEAAKLYGMVDCIFSVYNADLTNVRIALPNRLYEAIYCELPIIVSKDTYLAQLVEEMGVGVAVSHKDETELKHVIKRLSTDKKYYSDFVQACREHKKVVAAELYDKQLKLAIDSLMNKT